MDPSTFCLLIENLTGTPLKDVSSSDRESLARILKDDSGVLQCAQFNELLLLVNKDRVQPAFFERFFDVARNSVES